MGHGTRMTRYNPSPDHGGVLGPVGCSRMHKAFAVWFVVSSMSQQELGGSGTSSRVSAGAYAAVREWLITGAALTIPFIITVMVLAFVLNFVANALTPVVGALHFLGLVGPVSAAARTLGLDAAYGPLLVQLGTVLTLLAVVFVVGFVATNSSSEREFSKGFHTAMEAIPGVGTVYTSFRRMSDVLVESDTKSFQDVKLIEFPNEGVYSFAFVTANPPKSIGEAAGHERMQTLFMPLAPNPVMGGFLVHVPAERVFDVDVTVEEAVSAIVTSGVAIGDTEAPSLSPEEMAALGHYGSDNGPVDLDEMFSTPRRETEHWNENGTDKEGHETDER